MSRSAAENDFDGLKRTLNRAVRITVALTMPAAFGLWALREPITTLLYQHGHFTAFDTRMTALSVFGLSFGLPAFAMVKVVLPAFYSRQDTKTPVRAGLSSLVANMVLNFAILAALYVAWVPDALKSQGVWQGLAGTREIVNPRWTRAAARSSTFHGRDVFAPAAAHPRCSRRLAGCWR